MAGYVSLLRKDIDRWQAAGLIDSTTAAALLRDADAQARRSISFGSILSILASALLGAALLLLIAANWEAFPRLIRVGMIFAVILGGYVGGALAQSRGSDTLAQALWLLAATAFGAGIALIGQMYHLTGDEVQAILVWCGGTALAALALRSGPLTVGAVLLAGTWAAMTVIGTTWRGGDVPYGYLLLVAALWAVSLWSRSVSARHLLLLSLMAFATVHFFDEETLVAPLILAFGSVALFAACRQAPDIVERWLGIGEGGLVQGLLGFITGMSAMQFKLYEETEFILVAIVVFAGIVGALLAGGRESRMLRWLAYTAFVLELCFVYAVLLGSMLGTAGFFVVAGLILALLAWGVRRLETRFAGPAVEGAPL